MSAEIPGHLFHFMRGSRAIAPLLIRLSELESLLHPPRSIDRPVFITGIARAGTTITLELVGRHSDVATHRYSDFVLPYLPVWWNWLFPRLPGEKLDEPVERLHGDGIMVTHRSPEAIEEMLWLEFFPALHSAPDSHVMSAATSNPAFERFYRNHIGKLLRVRKQSRYVTKNNYLVGRLGYLLGLFPDARVLIIVRDPVNHIASLMKQHRMFHGFSKTSPRQLTLVNLAGHHEFGPGRLCPHLATSARVAEIERNWRDGHEVRGWALLWAMVYDHVANQLRDDPTIRRATHVVTHEGLCDDSRDVIAGILEHTELAQAPFEPVIDEYAKKLHRPSYYEPNYTSAERADIEAIARPTYERIRRQQG